LRGHLTNPPEGFDPDDLVPTLRRFDMASLGEIVRGLSGGDTRTAAVHAAIVASLSEERADGEVPA
jgi:hypothetical protein